MGHLYVAGDIYLSFLLGIVWLLLQPKLFDFAAFPPVSGEK